MHGSLDDVQSLAHSLDYDDPDDLSPRLDVAATENYTAWTQTTNFYPPCCDISKSPKTISAASSKV